MQNATQGNTVAVAVLGASPKPSRFSNKAIRLLCEHGYTVYPVHPNWQEIEGLRVLTSMADLPERVDTVTVYLSPALGEKELPALLAARPRRVILNPGTESDHMADTLRAAGIEVVEDCTLVMLRGGYF